MCREVWATDSSAHMNTNGTGPALAPCWAQHSRVTGCSQVGILNSGTSTFFSEVSRARLLGMQEVRQDSQEVGMRHLTGNDPMTVGI